MTCPSNGATECRSCEELKTLLVTERDAFGKLENRIAGGQNIIDTLRVVREDLELKIRASLEREKALADALDYLNYVDSGCESGCKIVDEKMADAALSAHRKEANP